MTLIQDEQRNADETSRLNGHGGAWGGEAGEVMTVAAGVAGIAGAAGTAAPAAIASAQSTHSQRARAVISDEAATRWAAARRYRDLLWYMTKREIAARYRGGLIGWAWILIVPLTMIAIYTVVFGVVFKARWGGGGGGGSLSGYALAALTGQLAFQLVGEPAARATTAISGIPNLVKKVVFPLEIMPVTVVAASALQALIALALCGLLAAVLAGGMSWTILLVPLALLPLLLTALGVAWALAALGVYVRDLPSMVGLALQALFFATPVVYPLSALPEPYARLVLLNPMTTLVELVRGCLIGGDPGSPARWIAAWSIGMAVAVLGNSWFRYARRGFADAL